jgi:hypothetical protein
MNKATGQVDTRIKYKVNDAEYELKNIEKLAFKYERHPQETPDINDKERERRIKLIGELKVKVEKVVKQAKEAANMIQTSAVVDLENQPLQS